MPDDQTSQATASQAQARWYRIELAFLELLDRPAHERESQLVAMESDESIRNEVRAMLAAGDDTSSALHLERRFVVDAPASSPTLTAGTVVGAYQIVELAGRGGMGDVYRARRIDGALDMEVAIKMLRDDVRSTNIARRFHDERRVLARLTHPHIATILDAGTTNTGRPWLALRFVDGVPFTQATRGKRLVDRLALFLKVVDAVAFAHANLVVHRDLKPGNILVTASGEPVLLDFGIATLLDDTGDPESAPSSERLLTPSYAAPEQRAGSVTTTATDVYSLGALLFETLTEQRLRATDAAPAAPSGLITDATMRRDVAGDLDAVVQKALQPSPADRYATASELAADIRRVLRGDAVVARPETWAMRAQRSVRRHKAVVISTVVVVVLLAVGLLREVDQSARLRLERDRAQAERAGGEDVLAFLTDLLGQSDPRVAPGGDSLRIRDFLTRAEAKIPALANQPERQVRLYRLLGRIRSGRGELEQAEKLLLTGVGIGKDSLGVSHPEVLRTQLELVGARMERYGSHTVIADIGPLLNALRNTVGPTHEDVATAYALAALVAVESDSSSAMLDSSVAVRARIGVVDSVEIASQLDARAAERGRRRRFAEAIAFEEAALRIVRQRFPADHPYVLTVTGNLSTYAGAIGDHRRAIALAREVLAVAESDTTPGLGLGLAMERVALATAQLPGGADSAEVLERHAIEAMRRRVDPAHQLITSSMRSLAIIRAARGDAAGALALLDSAIARTRSTPDSTSQRYMIGQRVPMLLRLGRISEAQTSLAAVHSVSSKFPMGSDYWINTQFWTGLTAFAADSTSHAITAWSGAIEQTAPGTPRSTRSQLRCALGVALRRTGRLNEAKPMLESDCVALTAWGLADRNVLQWYADSTVRTSR